MYKNNIKIFFLLFLSITVIIFSCGKDGLNDSNEVSVVQLRLEGVDFMNASLNKEANSKGTVANGLEVQSHRIPLTEDMSMVATLIPETSARGNLQEMSSLHKTATTQSTLRELATGTKFMVLVYNASNQLVAEREYTYAPYNPNQDNQLKYENLIKGETYTFVAYSINSKERLPAINNKQRFLEATLPTVSTELLYYKEKITVGSGLNYLNVRLKHQFSEVRTTIEIDQTGTLAGSVLLDMTSPLVTPSYQSADFQINNGQKKYNTRISSGTALPVIIPSNGIKTITSEPVFVISDGTNSTFEIPSIRINQFTKSMRISNFILTPGVRYNLKLEIGCPCLADAIPSGVLDVATHNSGNPKVSTYEFEEADFGAEFDIYRIDNSINMIINEEPLYIGSYASNATAGQTSNNEIQFQGFGLYPDNALFPNIEFEDGTRWGVNSIKDIFNMDGRVLKAGTEDSDSTKSKAILRITIDKSGKVAMYGSKNESGGPPFYPLRLINSRSITIGNTTRYIRGRFNESVMWNSSGVNKVVISQKVNSTTFLNGYVSGKKIVPCSSLVK
jgi:hypothetical protein